MIVEKGISQLTKHNEELCGDQVETYQDQQRFFLILSDGLGSGVKANILATLTSKIILTMVREGINLSEIIDTVVKTLPVCRVRKVAYATFSLVEIDKLMGRVTLIEFDNPAAVLIRKNSVIDIKGEELLINDYCLKRSTFFLKKEDVLVLFSDGVIHAGIGAKLKLGWPRGKVVNYLLKLNRKDEISMDTVAGHLAEACNSFYQYRPGDDTTIVALKARTELSATIVVGPPADRNRDQEVVNLLKNEPGKKVVCGGSTSQMVARELGESVIVNWQRAGVISGEMEQIPPAGTIKGVDLVTEGVLTLQAVYRVLSGQQGIAGISKQNSIIYRFIDILKRSDKLTFLVGQAINPAYQNPDLPLSRGVKEELVVKLADLLLKEGKEINIKKF